MNRLFARLLVIVFLGLLAAAGQAAMSASDAALAWLHSPTPCAQCT